MSDLSVKEVKKAAEATDNAVCKIPGGGFLRGTVNIPPSKSAAHRAMLCAALAEGRSVIAPIELSNDMRATLNAISALGAKAELSGQTLTIDGIGGHFGNSRNEPVEINCNQRPLHRRRDACFTPDWFIQRPPTQGGREMCFGRRTSPDLQRKAASGSIRNAGGHQLPVHHGNAHGAAALRR